MYLHIPFKQNQHYLKREKELKMLYTYIYTLVFKNLELYLVKYITRRPLHAY